MTGLSRIMLAATEVETFCHDRGWEHCFIGGVAVQRWGKPRITLDVDLTLLTGFGDERKFIAGLLGHFKPRRPDALEFALTTRVLLVATPSGTEVDISLGAMEFEYASVARASPWAFKKGHAIKTCSAEDLIVHKVFAGRGRDWDDVETVLILQQGKLNLDQVRRDLQELLELKEDEEALPQFERLVEKVRRRLQ